jgi:DNA-directed RNA polymerase sigma subunit (sigma70/sigma32)
MSIRRKSSANASPPDTPHGVKVAPSPRSLRRPAPSKKNSSKAEKLRSTSARTLKLQAGGSKPLTDPTLEELLQIKPQCLRKDEELNKEKVATQRVEEAKDALGRLECEIISALFPSSGLPASLEEVAQRLGMTVKEVRDIADDALRGLRGTKSSRPRISTVWN